MWEQGIKSWESFWQQRISPSVNLSKAMKIRNWHKILGKRNMASQGWMHCNITTLQGEKLSKKIEELGSSMFPSPACDSKHTQLTGNLLLWHCGEGGLSCRLRTGLLKQEKYSAGQETLVHQSTNYIKPERVPLILLEVTHWMFPKYITVSGSYISTTKLEFCQYCSY